MKPAPPVQRRLDALVPPPAWRATVPALLASWAVLILLYRETAVGMVQIWLRSDTFAHAILVLPIVAWLVFRRRAELATLTPAPAPLVLLPMAGAALLWLLGELSATNALGHFALVALLALTVPAVAGLEVARRLLFPLGFLFFAVPIGEFMLPQLMAWTADFTVAALRLSGIPVYREGMQFVIPTGTWSVVEACSGVRYLMASFMTGTLYAYLNYRSPRRRLAFAVVSLVVPVVANWVRAYMIVMLGHLSSNRLAVGADHLLYGWVFFGVVILLMFLIGRRWAEDEAPPRAGRPAGVGRPRAGQGAWAVALAVALLAVAPSLAERRIHAGEPAGAPELALPELAGWRAEPHPPVAWQPQFARPPAQVVGSYAAPGGGVVGTYIAYYRRQDSGPKLVGSSNVLVSSSDASWRQVATGRLTVARGGDALEVRSARLRGASLPHDSELVVWRLYWINGRWTSSDAEAKLFAVWERLLGHGDDAAAVVLHALETRPGEAEALLEAFVRDNLARLDAHLRKTRDGG